MEDDDRRITNRCVMTCEIQLSRLPIHAEDSDVVAALITGIKKAPGRIEIETARVIASRRLIRDEGQLAGLANGKDPDAVVQAIARVDESAIV